MTQKSEYTLQQRLKIATVIEVWFRFGAVKKNRNYIAPIMPLLRDKKGFKGTGDQAYNIWRNYRRIVLDQHPDVDTLMRDTRFEIENFMHSRGLILRLTPPPANAPLVKPAVSAETVTDFSEAVERVIDGAAKERGREIAKRILTDIVALLQAKINAL